MSVRRAVARDAAWTRARGAVGSAGRPLGGRTTSREETVQGVARRGAGLGIVAYDPETGGRIVAYS